MKQLIVLISMIMLGVAIAGIVGQFGTNAQALATSATTKLTALQSSFDAAK